MVKVSHIHKYFNKDTEREVHALDDVSLTINDGEFSVITGASGCGKTTLLNAIGALDQVDSGEIYIGETNIATLDESQRSDLRLNHIGFVFQAYNLVPVLSVEENIGFIMRLRGFSKDSITKRVKEVAEIQPTQRRTAAARRRRAGRCGKTAAGAGGRADSEPGFGQLRKSDADDEEPQ